MCDGDRQMNKKTLKIILVLIYLFGAFAAGYYAMRRYNNTGLPPFTNDEIISMLIVTAALIITALLPALPALIFSAAVSVAGTVLIFLQYRPVLMPLYALVTSLPALVCYNKSCRLNKSAVRGLCFVISPLCVLCSVVPIVKTGLTSGKNPLNTLYENFILTAIYSAVALFAILLQAVCFKKSLRMTAPAGEKKKKNGKQTLPQSYNSFYLLSFILTALCGLFSFLSSESALASFAGILAVYILSLYYSGDNALADISYKILKRGNK